MLLQAPMFEDYEWPIKSLKQLRRLQKAAHKRSPAKCILCNAKMEYNPGAGWYMDVTGQRGGCGAQFETGSVHHVLDNGKRSHRFADSDISTAIRG